MDLSKKRKSSVVVTDVSSSTTVRTTHCVCGDPGCDVCRVEERHSPVVKKRRVVETSEEDVLLEDADGDVEAMSETDNSSSLPPLPSMTELEKYNRVLQNDSRSLHELMIKTSFEKVREYEIQGSVFCEKYCCLSDAVKEDSSVQTYNMLTDVGKSVICKNKGACRYGCVGACTRLAAYQSYARYVGAKERTPLPTCVRIYINALYGSSVVGYKKK